MTHKRLITAARAARLRSFSPYSHFRVGAAVLSRTGKIFTGCNIENSSYGLTVCAERTALFKAVSEGHRRFVAMAIATDHPEFVSPCGACRQVLQDLAGNIEIILCSPSGRTKVLRLADLFPHPFALTDHQKKR